MADLELEVTAAGDGEYRIAARSKAAGDAMSPPVRFPLEPIALGRALDAVELAIVKSTAQSRRIPSIQERPAQEFGAHLFQFLFQGQVAGHLAAARNQAALSGTALRIRLRIRPPALAALPWELLYDSDQDQYLCLDAPLIRHPEVLHPQRPLAVTPPLRILAMSARPNGLGVVSVEHERQRLEEALSPLVHSRSVELEWVPGPAWQDLRTALGRGSWHVFHFIGHGGFDAGTGEGVLALADEQGRRYDLSASDLGMLLGRHRSLRLAVLNACESARSSETDSFSSTAATLTRRGLPAVVAMQYDISDPAAVTFARDLYEGIAVQQPVDEAVTLARQAVKLSRPGTLEWVVPVLHLRAEDAELFEIGALPPLDEAESPVQVPSEKTAPPEKETQRRINGPAVPKSVPRAVPQAIPSAVPGAEDVGALYEEAVRQSPQWARFTGASDEPTEPTRTGSVEFLSPLIEQEAKDTPGPASEQGETGPKVPPDFDQEVHSRLAAQTLEQMSRASSQQETDAPSSKRVQERRRRGKPQHSEAPQPVDADHPVQRTPLLAADIGLSPDSGKMAGHFVLHELIGVGDTTYVYRAQSLRDEKMQAAVKVLQPKLRGEKRAVQRFQEEDQAARDVSHPRAVSVLEVGVSSSLATPYVTMELVRGIPVKDWAKPPATVVKPWQTASVLARDVLEVLAVTETQVHGHWNISNHSVFMTVDGGVKIKDFADRPVMISPDRGARTKGWFRDFVNYAAPECFTNPDNVSDVYSVGCLMYELATGKPPFAGNSASDIIREQAIREPKAPSRIARGIPKWFDKVVLCAMSKSPEERFQSARQMRLALERASLPRIEPMEDPRNWWLFGI